MVDVGLKLSIFGRRQRGSLVPLSPALLHLCSSLLVSPGKLQTTSDSAGGAPSPPNFSVAPVSAASCQNFSGGGEGSPQPRSQSVSVIMERKEKTVGCVTPIGVST